MSGFSRRRRFPSRRRTYKRKRAYSRRRPSIYKRRSYKSRRFYRAPRAFRSALHSTRARRYTNLSVVPKKTKAFFKSSSYVSTGRLGPVTTVRTPYFVAYNFLQNSVSVAAMNAYSPTTTSFPQLTGLEHEVWPRFYYTRVVCSRLTVTIERQDGLDVSPWEFSLTPVNRSQYVDGVTLATRDTQSPVWSPGALTGTEAKWQSLIRERGTRRKMIGSPMGGQGPMKIRLSSTVLQSAMNLLPGSSVNPGYAEVYNTPLGLDFRNYWMLGVFCQNPTASGQHDFTIQVRFTVWLKAYVPKLTYLFNASTAAPTSPDAESKEEKSRGEEGPDSEDDDPSLDQFVDLRVVEAPKRPSMAPPSPAPAASGSELRRTVSRAVVRP